MHDRLDDLLRRLEADALLTQVDELARRLDALDTLDAHFPPTDGSGGAGDVRSALLYARAEAFRCHLESINATLFAELRSRLKAGEGAAAMLRWVETIMAFEADRRPLDASGYDSLDEFMRSVLCLREPGPPQMLADIEMVAYQPTPARHIQRLFDLAPLTGDDVLVDLGSGLGHVPILAALCTESRSIGIELEPVYVASARQCADDLLLQRCTFQQQDARLADLTTGTVFYLHTPFRGSVLRDVLDRLQRESTGRRIRVCTYGPCTSVVRKGTMARSFNAD